MALMGVVFAVIAEYRFFLLVLQHFEIFPSYTGRLALQTAAPRGVQFVGWSLPSMRVLTQYILMTKFVYFRVPGF